MPNCNNTDKTPNGAKQPTIADVLEGLKYVANKQDMMDLKNEIIAINETNKAKIEAIETGLDKVVEVTTAHAEEIAFLQGNLEALKQEKLINNICISGLPQCSDPSQPAKMVHEIAKILGVPLDNSTFTAYSTTHSKFIIAAFTNIEPKKAIINKMRAKRSLMVEEVLGGKSNSQIYISDHLTPYMKGIFLKARHAKKAGSLASVSSHDGKIKVRKSLHDRPIVILHENQLNTLIEMQYSTDDSHDGVVTESETRSNTDNKTQQHPDTNVRKNTDRKVSKNKRKLNSSVDSQQLGKKPKSTAQH